MIALGIYLAASAKKAPFKAAAAQTPSPVQA